MLQVVLVLKEVIEPLVDQVQLFEDVVQLQLLILLSGCLLGLFILQAVNFSVNR